MNRKYRKTVIAAAVASEETVAECPLGIPPSPTRRVKSIFFVTMA